MGVLQPNILSSYGECITQYEGKGELIDGNNNNYSCDFVIGQLSDGQIVLLCSLPANFNFLMTYNLFSGISTKGKKMTGKISNRINFLPEINPSSPGVMDAFRMHEVEIALENDDKITELHYGIVNFIFATTDFTTKNLPICLNKRINLHIQPLSDYTETAGIITTLKTIAPTCEAIVEITNKYDLDSLNQAITDFCYIISVGRGTKINWIYCDQYDCHKKLKKRIWYSHVTKPYTPLPTIDYRQCGAQETRIFIEGAYIPFLQHKDDLALCKGTIDSYLDAKSENDYLEMRGVKLSVCLEILKNHFKRAFNTGKKNTFLELIEKICAKLKMNCPLEEIKRVKDIRNALIHEGTFFCKTKKGKNSLLSPVQEFLFLLHFTDRLFLRLFEYSGTYIDWHEPSNPVRRTL